MPFEKVCIGCLASATNVTGIGEYTGRSCFTDELPADVAVVLVQPLKEWLWMAKKFDGLVAILGSCHSFCLDTDFVDHMQEAQDTVVIDYDDDGYKEYLLTPRMLATWMCHPRFRMPK